MPGFSRTASSPFIVRRSSALYCFSTFLLVFSDVSADVSSVILDWEIQVVFSAENAVPKGTGGSLFPQHQFPQKSTSYCGSRTAPSPTHCGSPGPAIQQWDRKNERQTRSNLNRESAKFAKHESPPRRFAVPSHSIDPFPKKNASAPATKCG